MLGLYHAPERLSSYSRFSKSLLCPHPLQAEDAYTDFLLDLGERLGEASPIFPIGDEYLRGTAREDLVADRFLFPFPAWANLERIQSKRFQLDRARELGVPTPRTSDAPTDEFGFPVIVKPSDPIGFRRSFQLKVFRCQSMQELEAAFERSRQFAPLVQEWIPGETSDLYFVGTYLTREGHPLGLFCGRKLRQIESTPGVGTTRMAESAWVDEVVEQSLVLLRGLDCYGLADVEFKRDPRDGRFKLMEVNPRLGQWHGFSAECGVNLSRIAYQHLLGADVTPVRASGKSKRWSITFLTATGTETARRDETESSPSRSWRTRLPAVPRLPYFDAVFALDDPMPGLWQGARLVGRVVRPRTRIATVSRLVRRLSHRH